MYACGDLRCMDDVLCSVVMLMCIAHCWSNILVFVCVEFHLYVVYLYNRMLCVCVCAIHMGKAR